MLLHGMITAATFRFGSEACAQGSGAPVARPRPIREISVPRHPRIRRLNQPVQLTLLAQPHAVCNAAFLKFPCYKGRAKFTAPYAVSSADREYNIDGIAQCNVGGRVATSWGLERKVKAHEPITTDSLGLFVYAPSCAATEKFQISYQRHPDARAVGPAEQVIVGTVSLAHTTLPGGARP